MFIKCPICGEEWTKLDPVSHSCPECKAKGLRAPRPLEEIKPATKVMPELKGEDYKKMASGE